MLIFNETWFFLPETAQFDTSNNLFCLVLSTLEFLFAVFFYNYNNPFPLFLYEVK